MIFLAPQTGSYTTKLKDEASTPRKGLSRSNSSPNIAKLMEDEEAARSVQPVRKIVPSVDRGSKPLKR